MQGDSSFLGTGWSFPFSFDLKSGSVQTSTGENDIRESLLILMNTIPGERVMHPEYGCGLHKLVFSSIGESEKTIIRDMIKNAVLYYEPRIDIESIDIDNESDMVNGTVWISVTYIVRAVNSRSNIVFPFYLIEGTNVQV